MKKIIAALSVFAFVFAFSGESVQALTGDVSSYTLSFTGDKDPKADGTKKTAKADKKSSSCSSSCSDKSAKASGDCSMSGDKSAKASTETGNKKVTTAEASTAPETK
ncbi:MAG: hypothetical protein V1775_04000 [Bacteroidota bacterium]